ncbi:Ubiquitin conjugation factor E4 A [Homalodisca vitripennis]|nr:Ubiquitin conjugation factor E4 A [Homalodisca vitripennis]
MAARFDNILGTKTIECLVYLSSEIRTIFCHRTMVDRIAAMLNYFLLHLVGPNKKNFKDKSRETASDTTASGSAVSPSRACN